MVCMVFGLYGSPKSRKRTAMPGWWQPAQFFWVRLFCSHSENTWHLGQVSMEEIVLRVQGVMASSLRLQFSMMLSTTRTLPKK